MVCRRFEEESVIIPFTLIKYYTGREVIRTIYAQASAPDMVPVVQRKILTLLKTRHPPQAEYNVQTLTAILSAARTIALALRIVLIVIAAIALLISGIGIMNIMLVTVKERTRKSVSAKPSALPAKKFWRSSHRGVLVSGGGAVIGILIGVAIPVIVQQLLPGNLRVPISGLSVIVAFLVSCSTGLFFGWLPASQAARLQPVESLRYE